MTVNLHTHTFRCGHAKGTERDYIEKAIAGGITHMGFSDHAPFAFPDGHESAFRVPVAQAQEYMDTLRALREEYRDRIQLYIGFEMEYYPLYFKDMLRTVIDLGAEYLLLGQHYIGNEYPGPATKMFSPTADKQTLISYVDTVIEGMATGVFTYLAHPDVINFFGDEDFYEEQMRRICATSLRYQIPLEINFLGLGEGRQYPNRQFWRLVGQMGCDVVFGCDAHKTKNAYDGHVLSVAEKIVDHYGLHLVSHPTLIQPLTGEKTLILSEK